MEKARNSDHNYTEATRSSVGISQYNRNAASPAGVKSPSAPTFDSPKRPNAISGSFQASTHDSKATATSSAAYSFSSSATAAATQNTESALTRWRSNQEKSLESSNAKIANQTVSSASSRVGSKSGTHMETVGDTRTKTYSSDYKAEKSSKVASTLRSSTNTSSEFSKYHLTVFPHSEKVSLQSKGGSTIQLRADQSPFKGSLSSTKAFEENFFSRPASTHHMKDTGYQHTPRVLGTDLSLQQTSISKHDDDSVTGRVSTVRKESGTPSVQRLSDSKPPSWRESAAWSARQRRLSPQCVSNSSSSRAVSQHGTPRVGLNISPNMKGDTPEAKGIMQFLGAYEMPTKRTPASVSSVQQDQEHKHTSPEALSLPSTTLSFSRRCTHKSPDKKYHLLDDTDDSTILLDDELSGLVSNLEEYQKRLERAAVNVMMERQRRRRY